MEGAALSQVQGASHSPGERGAEQSQSQASCNKVAPALYYCTLAVECYCTLADSHCRSCSPSHL